MHRKQPTDPHMHSRRERRRKKIKRDAEQNRRLEENSIKLAYKHVHNL